MPRRPASRPTAPGTPRAPLPLPAALAVVAASLLLAACGGSSSSPGVAHVGTSSASSGSSGSSGGTPESKESSAAAQQKLVKYAQCMRTHGEPEFPEPTEGNIQIHSQNGHGPNPESSQWKAAEKACKNLMPAPQAPSPAQTAKLQEQALKMAQCMRSHGVPSFPDPTFSTSGGGFRVTQKIGKNSGINPSSPQFQAAQKACQGSSPLGKGVRIAAPAPGHAGSSVESGSSGQSGEATAVAP